MTFTHAPTVLILGGSPAGLTTAYRLASKGYRVTVTDLASSKETPEEKADTLSFPLLGCYQRSQALFRDSGLVAPSTGLAESSLEFLLPNGRLARFPKSRFPSPLHQLFSIGRFTGLSWKGRWKLLSWLEQLWEGSQQLAADLEHRTAQDWMDSVHRDSIVSETVWNPLALWLTGNALKHLSADAFVASLTPFFLSKAAANRVYYPRSSWEDFFTTPMMARIARAGGTILPDLESRKFEYQHDRIVAVGFADGSRLSADWYVTSIPPQRLTPLLPERWLTRYAYFQQITELTTLPWTVIEVPIPNIATTARTILHGTGPAPVMIWRPLPPDDGSSLSLFIPGKREQDDIDRMVATTLRSLNLPTPTTGTRLDHPQERSYRALALFPGTKTKRPIQRSPIANLCLAGAWTDTGWPANFESSVVSGERCAQLITESGRLDGLHSEC